MFFFVSKYFLTLWICFFVFQMTSHYLFFFMDFKVLFYFFCSLHFLFLIILCLLTSYELVFTLGAFFNSLITIGYLFIFNSETLKHLFVNPNHESSLDFSVLSFSLIDHFVGENWNLSIWLLEILPEGQNGLCLTSVIWEPDEKKCWDSTTEKYRFFS